MERSVRAFDHQYLETADLLVLRAEIQKLKDSIRAAEASNLSRLKEPRYGLPVFSPQGPQPVAGGPSFLSSSWGRFWNERGRQLSRPYFSGGLM